MSILDTNIRSVNQSVGEDRLVGHRKAVQQLFQATSYFNHAARRVAGDEYYAYTDILPESYIRGNYPLIRNAYCETGYRGMEIVYQPSGAWPGNDACNLVVWIDHLESLYLDSLTVCGYRHITVLDGKSKLYYYRPCGDVTVWELLAKMKPVISITDLRNMLQDEVGNIVI